MKAKKRRKRAVTQQIKRHGTLIAPLSRSAKRAVGMAKIFCGECDKRVARRRMTDHFIVDHPDKIEEG